MTTDEERRAEQRAENRMGDLESNVKSLNLSMRFQIEALGDAIRTLTETVEKIDHERRMPMKILLWFALVMLTGNVVVILVLGMMLP